MTVAGLSRHRHLDELDEPLNTNEGVLSPAVRRARARANLTDGGALATTLLPVVLGLVQQAINANGAISVAAYDTALTSVTTTGVAFTMAAGTIIGQLKRIHLVADGGSDGVVTFNTNATLTFADVGDYAVLIWDGAAWTPISLGNEASGDIGPAYVPAS